MSIYTEKKYQHLRPLHAVLVGQCTLPAAEPVAGRTTWGRAWYRGSGGDRWNANAGGAAQGGRNL